LISSTGTESGIFETSVMCGANEQPRVFIVEIRDVLIFELVGGRSHNE
jgi:hypothetical protein